MDEEVTVSVTLSHEDAARLGGMSTARREKLARLIALAIGIEAESVSIPPVPWGGQEGFAEGLTGEKLSAMVSLDSAIFAALGTGPQMEERMGEILAHALTPGSPLAEAGQLTDKEAWEAWDTAHDSLSKRGDSPLTWHQLSTSEKVHIFSFARQLLYRRRHDEHFSGRPSRG